jgi:hypothetical protein
VRSGVNFFSKPRLLWAETRYDSERARIRVNVYRETGFVGLTAFGRASTNERCYPSVGRLHGWGAPPTPTAPRVILDALGLFSYLAPSRTRNGTPWVTSDMILEAETIALLDTNESIDGKYFLVPYGTPRNAYRRPEF